MPKIIVNIQITHDNYCSLRCLLHHLHKVDTHRERVSHCKKHFTELNSRQIQIPVKTKITKKIEEFNNFEKSVFELTSFFNFLAIYITRKLL